jgi:hypothetical protein
MDRTSRGKQWTVSARRDMIWINDGPRRRGDPGLAGMGTLE